MLAIRPDLPIILCTGFSETVDEEKAEGLGIKEYVQKPFTVTEISNMIRRTLSKKTGSSEPDSKLVGSDQCCSRVAGPEPPSRRILGRRAKCTYAQSRKE